jgi:thiol-disulfide isomerase/thioredoxin
LLWIDEKTFALRRVDLPTAAFLKNLEQNGPVTRLELYAEFPGAKFDAPVPAAAFEFEVPAGAKLVKRLLGPAPSPPSKLLGQSAPEFTFTTADGTKITRESFKDKVVVLDFWFTQCTPCQESFPLLNRVYQRYKDAENVMFLAVNADDSSLSNQAVLETMKNWGSELPLARDPNQDIRKAFDVTGMPALFVVGPDGAVQFHEVGLNANIAKELPETIDSLLAGKSTKDLVQKRYEQRLAEFEQLLATPPEIPTSDGQAVEIPKAKIEPRSEPAHHRLVKLWTAEDVKMAGNIVVADKSDSDRALLVIDNWNSVVEVSLDGKVAARHELSLPPDSVVSTLRTAVDGSGKRYYAAFLTAQQQLHVFDQQWKPVLSFPPASDPKHEGIGDVQFSDLDGDGALELAVGYWGDLGLQYIAMDGRRLWTDRKLQYVLRMAEIEGEDAARRLLAIHSRGALAVFRNGGNNDEEIAVTGRPLQTVYAADLTGDSTAELCGLSFRSLGANSLVGFNRKGEELWNYDLPTGVHEKPIESITSARLFGEKGQWLVAGADGSVHILADNGKLIDKFHYGHALAGLAGTQADGKAMLLIASDNGLEAWTLEPTDGPQAANGDAATE